MTDECRECGTTEGPFVGPRCRPCNGERFGRRPRVSGYVSPDDAERYGDHYDLVEAHSRARVLRGGP